MGGHAVLEQNKDGGGGGGESNSHHGGYQEENKGKKEVDLGMKSSTRIFISPSEAIFLLDCRLVLALWDCAILDSAAVSWCRLLYFTF